MLRNTAMFKLIPLLCTHVYSYIFSTVHPRGSIVNTEWEDLCVQLKKLKKEQH